MPELIATIILLIMAIGCIAPVYSLAFDLDPDLFSHPNPSISGSMIGGTLQLQHGGGAAVDHWSVFQDNINVSSGTYFYIGQVITVNNVSIGSPVLMFGDDRLIFHGSFY